jgi:hypothetical protein
VPTGQFLLSDAFPRLIAANEDLISEGRGDPDTCFTVWKQCSVHGIHTVRLDVAH